LCETDFSKQLPIDNFNNQKEKTYVMNQLSKFQPDPIVNNVRIAILLR